MQFGYFPGSLPVMQFRFPQYALTQHRIGEMKSRYFSRNRHMTIVTATSCQKQSKSEREQREKRYWTIV